MRPEATRTGEGASRLRGWLAWAAVGGIVAIAATTVLFIAGTGTGKPVSAPAGKAAAPSRDGRHAAAKVDQLAGRVREAPDDVEGWTALGRSLAALGRFQEAADAMAQASRRRPRDASLLADGADFLAMAQGRRFAGEPDRLIRAALEADPRHTKALALAGTSAFQSGDFAGAASHWQRLLALLPPGTEMAREVEARAREARARAIGQAHSPTRASKP